MCQLGVIGICHQNDRIHVRLKYRDTCALKLHNGMLIVIFNLKKAVF